MRIKGAFSGFSSNDIAAAKAFYGQRLGMGTTDTEGGLSLGLGGGQRVFIYPKVDHEPATYTVLNLEVDDIERAVDELTAAGITMERYGDAFEQDSRGIARAQGPLIAWFKDPAGNIISVIEVKAAD
jgi:catechol 2,3-dioxygenase-like lactoylglutathione lyase family enzyme